MDPKKWITYHAIDWDYEPKDRYLHNVPIEVDALFEKSIQRKGAYSVYRGYSFQNKTDLGRWFNSEVSNQKEYAVNNEILLSPKHVTSWSLDINRSADFANGPMCNGCKYGILLMAVVKPSQVLGDVPEHYRLNPRTGVNRSVQAGNQVVQDNQVSRISGLGLESLKNLSLKDRKGNGKQAESESGWKFRPRESSRP